MLFLFLRAQNLLPPFMKKIIGTAVCVLLLLFSSAQSKYTISGNVKDDKTGEELIGASVF
jgi:hypothetical protein